MPALNFKSQFVGLVQTGKKTQTIRAPRKHPFLFGQMVKLFTGMRTRGCRQIGYGVVPQVLPILIECQCTQPDIRLDGVWLTAEEIAALAQADGFESGRELAGWFEGVHGLPFEGVLIRWKLATAP